MENEPKEEHMTPELKRELEEVLKLSRLFVTMGGEEFFESLRERREKEKKDC